MAYDFFIDGVLLPVAPSKLTIKVNNQNETMNLINESEVNILKKAGLTDIDFEVLLPQVKYPVATYKNGFQAAKVYLDKLEELKTSKEPFQFIVTRKFPNGKMLFDTNMTVSLEDYKIVEDAKEGFDVMVSVSLKQYRKFGTKIFTVDKEKKKAKLSKKTRSTAKKPKAKMHTVKRGESLWVIAKYYYNDGSKYPKIFNANKDKIKNPSLIYPGQKLTIPS